MNEHPDETPRSAGDERSAEVEGVRTPILAFRKQPRRGTLEPVRKRYDACRHDKTFIHEESREVTCQNCDAILDPFSVLLELAHQQRRYLDDLDAWDAQRESLLAERYDRQWEREHEGVLAAPADPDLRRVWDTFQAAIGEKFQRMYRRKAKKRVGPEWYGVSTDGMVVSYEYARSKLIPKAVAKP